MKASSALNLLLLLGAAGLLVYGYNKGWFKNLSGTTTQYPPSALPVVSGTPSSNTINSSPEVVVTPEQVVVDHSDSGYVLIPIDSAGNVVPSSRAVQYIKYSALGQDCNIQYRDRIYYVQVPTKPFPVVTTTP